MSEETIAPQEELNDPATPGNQVPAGAQVPGVDVTTGKPDGTTDAEPKQEPAAQPEAPAPAAPAEAPAEEPAKPGDIITEEPAK